MTMPQMKRFGGRAALVLAMMAAACDTPAPTVVNVVGDAAAPDGDAPGADADAGEPGDDIPRVAEDVVERWSPPSQLHGREPERAALAALAERARAGEAVSVAVTGAPGVGKTTLVRDFAARFQDGGGVFAGAKFDPFSRATPLGAVTRAVGGAVRSLLTLSLIHI